MPRYVKLSRPPDADPTRPRPGLVRVISVGEVPWSIRSWHCPSFRQAVARLSKALKAQAGAGDLCQIVPSGAFHRSLAPQAANAVNKCHSGQSCHIILGLERQFNETVSGYRLRDAEPIHSTSHMTRFALLTYSLPSKRESDREWAVLSF